MRARLNRPRGGALQQAIAGLLAIAVLALPAGAGLHARRGGDAAAAGRWPEPRAVQSSSVALDVHPVSGRPIAPVMSHLGADWLDRPERAAEEQPERALDAIRILPGQVVADVGAGSGYFTVRLARRVGVRGRVYATDIQPEMLARLEARLAREHIRNVELVRATEEDPGLPRRCCHLIIMVDVYHELARPQVILGRLRESLTSDGRLVLLEYRKEDPHIPIRPEHKMSIAEAKVELEAENFQLEHVIGILPRQHILVFRPR